MISDMDGMSQIYGRIKHLLDCGRIVVLTQGGSDGQKCPQASRPPEEERKPWQAPERLVVATPQTRNPTVISVGFMTLSLKASCGSQSAGKRSSLASGS